MRLGSFRVQQTWPRTKNAPGAETNVVCGGIVSQTFTFVAATSLRTRRTTV